MTRECIFCGDTNLSNEHIFPQWLLRLLDIKKFKVYNQHFSWLGIKISERPLTLNKFVNGLVCIKCNNEWLSAIEEQAKVILEDLIIGKSEKNSVLKLFEHRGLVAKWAFKTAIILNRGTNYRKIIPRRHYRLFYKNRRIPENVFISIGFSKTMEFDWVQTQNVFHVSENTDGIAKDPRFSDIYNITFHFGHLLIKVVYSPFYQFIYKPEGSELMIHPNVFRSKDEFEYNDLHSLSIGGVFEQR